MVDGVSSAPAHGDIVVVVGTRPEAVKLASVIDRLGARGRLLHTGQHFDIHLWSAVSGDLGLPEPAERVTVGALTRGEQIGAAVTGITRVLSARPASAIVVQGDTNSTLAGALAGNATRTPVVHVEAGLRSGDPSMPEEANRLLTDRISDLCCAPIQANADLLLREGVAPERIAVTGNTLHETMARLLPEPADQARILAAHRLRGGDYVLATVHREATVEDPSALADTLTALCALARSTRVVLPLHPRTWARASQLQLTHLFEGVDVLEPLPPKVFLALEARAGLIVSDSGGVQEEAALLGVPLVVLRDSTERPELLGTWCRLVGTDPIEAVVSAAWADAEPWRARIAVAEPPYPSGDAAGRIVAALDDLLARGRR